MKGAVFATTLHLFRTIGGACIARRFIYIFGMKKIPNDLSPVLIKIDKALKAEGVSPHARPMRAIMEFGNRYGLPMPFTETVSPGAPAILARGAKYTSQIYDWYERVYGDKIKLDLSEKAKVAVLADNDIWEVRIPYVYGLLTLDATRDISGAPIKKLGSTFIVNACSALKDITSERLAVFTDTDLAEVYSMYRVGLDVKAAFDSFRRSHQMFVEAESDWSTATMHLTAQRPNYGQSRWASQQMCEKFMKGLINVIGKGNPTKSHSLDALHEELAISIHCMKLKHLLPEIQCSAAVRYGQKPSNREQAYSAHKSGLLLVRYLSSVQNTKG